MINHLKSFIGLFCVLLVLAGTPAYSQAPPPSQTPSPPVPEIVAEPNLQVFTVLAAINAAGYDEAANKPELAPMRAAVRKELAAKQLRILPALREFYQRHQLPDPGRNLSQYVSLALLLGAAPAFELQASASSLPPDIADMDELVPLIVEFYKEADIGALWEKYQPAMEEESERYRRFLTKTIQEMNAYLRMDTSGYFNRRFAVYISPLGAPNQTNARSYGDRYYIVVGPSAEIPEEDIRHGWLHYLLDPYPYKYARNVEAKASLQRVSESVPGIDPSVKSDFGLQITESLIRAIQARRSKGTAEEKQRTVEEAVQTGDYLTAYFFDAMAMFEKQPVGMRLYYPDMIDAISVKTEENRLAKVHFRAPVDTASRETLGSSVEQMVRQGEDYIARGQYDEARRVFQALTQEYGAQPHAIYDLAIVATLQKQPATAREYFMQAATLSADPHIKAWSHIYLGRMLDMQGNRDDAAAEYTAALAAGDPAAETKTAAEKGLQQGFSPPQKADNGKAPEGDEKPRVRVPLGKD